MFFLDDRSFMEPTGFWTRADSTTELFVDGGGASSHRGSRSLTLLLRAGPVATAADLGSGRWQTRIPLVPGASEVVQMPDEADGGWPIRIHTEGGFRPAQHDPVSADRRYLGVWIEAVP